MYNPQDEQSVRKCRLATSRLRVSESDKVARPALYQKRTLRKSTRNGAIISSNLPMLPPHVGDRFSKQTNKQTKFLSSQVPTVEALLISEPLPKVTT